MARRAALWGLQHGRTPPALPAPGLVCLPAATARAAEDPEAAFLQAMGWVPAGPVWLRLDVAERVAQELAWATRIRAFALPADLASRLSVRAELLPPVLRALGVRLIPGAAEGEAYGPPVPPMLVTPRKAPSPSPPARRVRQADGPFAALADWQG